MELGTFFKMREKNILELMWLWHINREFSEKYFINIILIDWPQTHWRYKNNEWWGPNFKIRDSHFKLIIMELEYTLGKIYYPRMSECHQHSLFTGKADSPQPNTKLFFNSTVGATIDCLTCLKSFTNAYNWIRFNLLSVHIKSPGF